MKEHNNSLIDEELNKYLEKVDFIKLKTNDIIRSINNSLNKDYQGVVKYVDNDGIIVKNVIDLKNATLVANEGIIKPNKFDKIFLFTISFQNSPLVDKAKKIIYRWPLYKKHVDIQYHIERFITDTFIPEQLLIYEKYDKLNIVFIPVQQYFRIGKYKERRNLHRICFERFTYHIESLRVGEHITYIANISSGNDGIPKFYSVGTKPHEVTHHNLKNEEFNFTPTHGGHIKLQSIEENKKIFKVDAGSNYLGRGVKTTLYTAKQVTKALKQLYPNYEFIPCPGRGAFGIEQSY